MLFRSFNIILLGTTLYLIGFMLHYFLGWNLYISSILIILIVILLNASGGMKAILTIDYFQGIFVSVAFIIVGCIVLFKIGGFWEFIHISLLSKSNDLLTSTLLPVDLNPFSKLWYAMPMGLFWSLMAGTSWTACNYSMVQRLLAAKNENSAQKAVIFTSFGGVLSVFIAYFIGVSVKSLNPELVHPDHAYLFAIHYYLPIGIRGLILVSLVASSISMINGLITSSTAMIVQDFFLRFFKQNSNSSLTKRVARYVQLIIVICGLMLLPISAKEEIGRASCRERV